MGDEPDGAVQSMAELSFLGFQDIRNGFVGGEANQYYPGLFEGTVAVEPPKTPEEGYTLTEDLCGEPCRRLGAAAEGADAGQALLHVFRPERHARAAPCAERRGSDKYKGKFEGGWDKLRQEIFTRQKAIGVIPDDAVLTARHKEIPSLDSMPADLKPVLARQMEIYAGFGATNRPRTGPRHRRPGWAPGARRHVDLLHHRRQRGLGGRNPKWVLQRNDDLERHGWD